MISFNGTRLNAGVAFGKVKIIGRHGNNIVRQKTSDSSFEVERLTHAIDTAEAELIKMLDNIDKSHVQEITILEAQKVLLKDAELVKSTIKMIREELVTAEYAVYSVGNTYIELLENIDDEYMRARALDVKDIISRITHILLNENNNKDQLTYDSIIISEDLTPSETVQMDKDKLKGIVVLKGSYNSHTAIIARTYNIPALIKTNISDYLKYDGMDAIIDGEEGIIYIDPDQATIQKMKQKVKGYQSEQESLEIYKTLEDKTKDGAIVNVYANSGSLEDVRKAVEWGASGIGLFRSEFVYLNKKTFPTEDYQFEIYKSAIELMQGKKGVIRTLDIGGDKTADYFELADEANPALGNRAIRYSLNNPDVFKTQLRAIYRASAFGNVAIMFPMIITVEEIKKIKEYIDQVKEELKKENIDFSRVETGIMIETPAASIISDLLAKEVDFFSIGTNDLTQYTLAADRQNPLTDKCFDTHHPAILRQIKVIIDNAHKENIKVSICGELATDEELISQLISYGIDGLSVPPSKILRVRKKVRESCRG